MPSCHSAGRSATTGPKRAVPPGTPSISIDTATSRTSQRSEVERPAAGAQTTPRNIRWKPSPRPWGSAGRPCTGTLPLLGDPSSSHSHLPDIPRPLPVPWGRRAWGEPLTVMMFATASERLRGPSMAGLIAALRPSRPERRWSVARSGSQTTQISDATGAVMGFPEEHCHRGEWNRLHLRRLRHRDRHWGAVSSEVDGGCEAEGAFLGGTGCRDVSLNEAIR